MALDPKNEFILSSSCDGSAKLWKIATETCVQTWSNLWDKSNDVCRSNTSASVAWHPDGDSFAIPCKDGVKLLSRQDFEPLKLNSPKAFFTSVAFSSNELVGGTEDGKLVFWKLNNGSQFSEVSSDKKSMICGIDWNPNEKDEIAFIKEDGNWGTVTNFLKGQKIIVDEDNMNPDELAAALFDDDDDDNENSFSIRQIKKETGFLDDDENTNQTTATDTDELLKPVEEPEKLPQVVQAPPQLDLDLQEPFQPGSTPAHLESRYMVWNSVGIVRSFTSEEESSIDVEFHDASIHHPIHLGNNHGYVMADLSTEAVVLASDGDESKLTCHHFGSSGLNKEWSIDMPEKEEILCICAGQNWVAAATDRRNLRIFSTGGMQKQVLSLPGPIVALSGWQDKCLVSVHLGLPLPGNQLIGTSVFSINECNLDFRPLPLAPRSILAWQGFTDDGIALIQDSAGFIRIFSKGSWIQVCDSKSRAKGKSDHYFMVGANLSEFSARCILVKGSRFPATLPKPVISVLPLDLPLCGIKNDKLDNEQSYWRAQIVSQSIPETKDQMEEMERVALLKLFAHACQLDHDARCLDICKLMSLETIQAAIKYASKSHKMQLASKISALAYEKQEEIEQEEEKQKMANKVYQESEDMFASQEDDIDMDAAENPLLAAENRRAAESFITPTPPVANNTPRNPFRKSTTPSSTPSGSRSGIVFDEIAKKDVIKSGNRPKISFGAKKIEDNSPLTSRTVTLGSKKEKENKSGNVQETQEKKEMLKGFLLWFEENSDKVSRDTEITDSDELRNKCLEMWQSLSSEAKKAYKTPRVPKKKRQISDENSSTSAKLAKFAA